MTDVKVEIGDVISYGATDTIKNDIWMDLNSKLENSNFKTIKMKMKVLGENSEVKFMVNKGKNFIDNEFTVISILPVFRYAK